MEMMFQIVTVLQLLIPLELSSNYQEFGRWGWQKEIDFLVERCAVICGGHRRQSKRLEDNIRFLKNLVLSYPKNTFYLVYVFV